jgi:isochorismate synthase
MKLAANVKRCLERAASLDLPFAVWRRPDGSFFEAAISCAPIEKRAVFGAPSRQPFFALNRFDAEQASIADAIPADVLIEGSEVRFYNGDAYQPQPVNAVQEQLRGAATSAVTDMPIQAGAAPVPVQTGEHTYKTLVRETVDAIRSGRFLKIVLSRTDARPLPDDYDLLSYLEALAALYPTAFTALVVAPGLGAWLVATPETLMSVTPGEIRTMALAGTQWAEGAEDGTDLHWPDKIIEEQALVARYIRDAFRDSGIGSVRERGPRTVRAANLYHLRSEFSAPVEIGGERVLADLLDRLHPTSAVCGMPKADALDYLRASEGYDRSYYTGFLGPVCIGGTTDLFVNLRSAQVIEDRIFLFVGGGIVAASDPDVEWEETVQKTRTIASVL